MMQVANPVEDQSVRSHHTGQYSCPSCLHHDCYPNTVLSEAKIRKHHAQNCPRYFTVFLDNHSEYLDGETGMVSVKTCVVIRLHSSGRNALYMLEDTSLTELQRDSKEDDLTWSQEWRSV